jgi:8-oxo-dGTP pyrophosphatase MutT (NUDIX family)
VVEKAVATACRRDIGEHRRVERLLSLRSLGHMPIPLFLAELRELVGTRPLWLNSAHAAVTNSSGDLLLCRRTDDDQWSLPGGIIEPGEQPADAVVREVHEEAGIVVDPVSLALVDVSPTFTYPSGDRAQYLDLIFRRRHVSGHARVADTESTAIEWFSPRKLPVLDRYQHRQIELALRDAQHTVFTSPSRPTDQESAKSRIRSLPDAPAVSGLTSRSGANQARLSH